MSPNIFINLKGRKSNFTVDKLNRHCLNQVIKVITTSSKIWSYYVSPDMSPEG